MAENTFKELSGLIEKTLMERGDYSRCAQLKKGEHFQQSGALLNLIRDPELGDIAKQAFIALQKIPAEQRKHISLTPYVPNKSVSISSAAGLVFAVFGVLYLAGNVNGTATLDKNEMTRIKELSQTKASCPPLGNMLYHITGAFGEERVKSKKGVWEKPNTGGPSKKKGKEYTHMGIDIIGLEFQKNKSHPDSIGNALIYSIQDGKVIFRDWKSGYGKCIDIMLEDSSIVRYGHLNNFFVAKSQKIKKGQKIARMGRTGLPKGINYGNHTHIEWIDKYGDNKNPVDLINMSALEQEVSRKLGGYARPDSLSR